MTTIAGTTSVEPSKPNRRVRYLLIAAGLVAFYVLLTLLPLNLRDFPERWDLGIAAVIDTAQSWILSDRMTSPIFLYGIDPLSDLIDSMLRAVEGILVGAPWLAVLIAVAFVAFKAGGTRLLSLSIFGMLMMGMFGLWVESMQTLALMGVSVAIALMVGIPVGILSARCDWLHDGLRPVLDALQTLPAFVYLIPVVLIFGVARVPAVVATVIYALPPAIRLTDMGIRHVSIASVEAADAYGASSWQKLRKVQLPLAMPSILVGVNQTIMMALGIVVIAALIGAPGLGLTVYVALGRQHVGRGLEAGLAIVLIAVIFDRISYGFSAESEAALRRRERSGAFSQLSPRLLNYTYWSTGLLLILLVVLLSRLTGAFSSFPASWHLSIAAPIDAMVDWMRDHLYQIGDLPIGTGPFSDFVTLHLLNPLRNLLQDWLPWPMIIATAGALCYLASGWRLATFGLLSLLLIGFMGLWAAAMDTLSQVLIAALFAVVVGMPIGIVAGRNDRFEQLLRPLLDLLQTIPTFVYLVPVIMLFNVGRVPGIIASVLYAIPPVIRLTDLGIRSVPHTTIEASTVFGATSWQTLLKVQLPLAKQSIMMGINQTIMMVLAMVVIAGLVGGGALGLEAVTGLAKSQVGRGMEAGLAIVILAIILDRLTQAWAQSD